MPKRKLAGIVLLVLLCVASLALAEMPVPVLILTPGAEDLDQEKAEEIARMATLEAYADVTKEKLQEGRIYSAFVEVKVDGKAEKAWIVKLYHGLFPVTYVTVQSPDGTVLDVTEYYGTLFDNWAKEKGHSVHWTMEEKALFFRLGDLAAEDDFYVDIPREGDISEEEAISAAKAYITSETGRDEAELAPLLADASITRIVETPDHDYWSIVFHDPELLEEKGEASVQYQVNVRTKDGVVDAFFNIKDDGPGHG